MRVNRFCSARRAFCLEGDLGYCEDSLFGSYRQAVRHLRTMTAATALVPSGAPSR
jgi:hypothetical protein